METFEVTQALMSISTVYHVRLPKEEAVLYTIKGSLMSSSPLFSLVEGSDGKELASLAGNFIKTKYAVIGPDKKELATLTFPAVAFKKTLTLTVGETEYAADGGVFKGVFQCTDSKGEVALEIAKEGSIRDKFTVKAHGALPKEVGLLAAVAIHSRFYEIV